MTILADRDIRNELNKQYLVVEPIDSDVQIQPASLDIRLGKNFISYGRPRQGLLRRFLDWVLREPRSPKTPLDHKDPDTLHTHRIAVLDGARLRLEPEEFILGHTLERVEIPNYLVAQVEGRSSIGRLGITVHITAGYIDPGFRGHITLEIKNCSPRPVYLDPGMRIGQLVFTQLKTFAEEPYGVKPGGKYQNSEGVISSKIFKDVSF